MGLRKSNGVPQKYYSYDARTARGLEKKVGASNLKGSRGLAKQAGSGAEPQEVRI